VAVLPLAHQALEMAELLPRLMATARRGSTFTRIGFSISQPMGNLPFSSTRSSALTGQPGG
jgi:hypothetical protein